MQVDDVKEHEECGSLELSGKPMLENSAVVHSFCELSKNPIKHHELGGVLRSNFFCEKKSEGCLTGPEGVTRLHLSSTRPAGW